MTPAHYQTTVGGADLTYGRENRTRRAQAVLAFPQPSFSSGMVLGVLSNNALFQLFWGGLAAALQFSD